MIVQMDKMEAPSRENAQRLYDKNVELENNRRRSVKARIPTDPNAWQQMRENYEGIILGNHDFSEQHNTEYLLWQLHYRRIEEFRAHFSAALSSSSSASQGGKVPTRPDRITKIRMQFKAFLSEATGFYHDLILKIKAKYGLPLGHFSEESDNQIVTEKDGQKYVEMKKGLVSCHRCLIYLGDLARYKGLYGEGDSKTRDYTAASSYYLQASSLWPSSGNPHHQLAILASYSGDELVSVYRYFRSLAVESPFSTARDNLIVAFEKNRQAYSQLPGDPRPAGAKESSKPVKSKGRGKGETRIAFKDTLESSPVKGEATTMDIYKSFCVRFVRLNGILFTRTSLETFADVLSTVSSGLGQLLSSGPDEELNFGNDAVESGLSLVRLVAILIFTVHNVNRDTEGQSYADILQRKVLLQNASIAIFEFMGHILKRCTELRDTSSSFLLPGILVFMEWLASRQDVASGNDVEVDQAAVRSVFWNNCVSFLNSILSNGLVSIDDEDETCFFNMSTYEEGETENRLALWEDIELRGFLPLLPAQSILDFSRKSAFGNDGNKEKKARVKRILAAGKVVTTYVRVDQKPIFFDSKGKRFSIGIPPQATKDISAVPTPNGHLEDTRAQNITYAGDLQMKEKLYEEPEEEDEEIVFMPIMMEKRHDASVRPPNHFGGIEPVQNPYTGSQPVSSGTVSSAVNDVSQQAVLSSSFQPLVAVSDINSEQLHAAPAHTSKWPEQETYLANGMQNLGFLENGPMNLPDMLENRGTSHPFPHPHSLFRPPHEDVRMPMPFSHPTSHPQPSLEGLGMSVPFPHPHSLPHPSIALHANGLLYNQARAAGSYFTSKASAIASPEIKADGSAANPLLALPDNARKSPVSRPHRHLGPPPGFNPLPSKHVNVSRSSSDQKSENQLLDDYSWLDGYQLPSSSVGVISSVNQPSSQASPWTMNTNNGVPGMNSFPFPGKQASKVQSQAGNLNSWPHHVPLEGAGQLLQGQQMEYLQQYIEGGQQFAPLPEHYQGNPTWSGRHLV